MGGGQPRRKRFVLAATCVAAILPVLFGATACDTAKARNLLSALPLAAESATSTYDRANFKHWIDANKNCRDTRAEVLISESLASPTFTSSTRCTVATGKWKSPYDGATWTKAGDVDIDHLVALKEAWESGASTWSSTDRMRYANDLDFSATLVAVTDNVNQSKSDRDPAEWLPPLTSNRCDYATKWVQVKYRWRLSVSKAEQTALATILSGSCGNRTVLVPPRAR